MEQSLTADDDEASSGHMEIADLVEQTWLTNLGSIRKKKCFGVEGSKICNFNFYSPAFYYSPYSSYYKEHHSCSFIFDKHLECTNNKVLILLSIEIREYLLTKGIIITVEYLPGALKKETNFQYWTVKDSRKLKLNPAVIHKTCNVLGTPDRTFCFQSF